MTTRAPSPYFGPPEAYPIEEVAVKLRVSPDFIKEHYDGPYTWLNVGKQSVKRIAAHHLHEWIDSRSSEETSSPTWGGFGGKTLQERTDDQAA